MDEQLEIQKIFSNSMLEELNSNLSSMQKNLEEVKMGLPPGSSKAMKRIEDCEKSYGNSMHALHNYHLFLNSASCKQDRTADAIAAATRASKLALHGRKTVFILGKDSSSEHIPGDEIQIFQLFCNLLKFACEEVSDEGASIWMDIAREHVDFWDTGDLPAGDYLSTTISFKSCRSNEDNIDNLFASYFASGRFNECIWLCTSREIAKRHNGLIRMMQDPDGRTVFKILLPTEKGIEAST